MEAQVKRFRWEYAESSHPGGWLLFWGCGLSRVCTSTQWWWGLGQEHYTLGCTILIVHTVSLIRPVRVLGTFPGGEGFYLDLMDLTLL